MPQIPMISDRSRPGVLDLPSVNPQLFGHQAGAAMTEFGQAVSAVGQKIQDAEDTINTIRMTGEYAVQLDQAKEEILKHPEIHRHTDMLELKSREIHDSLLEQNPDASSAVQRVFRDHVAKGLAPATIEVRHAGQVIRTRQVLASFAETQDKLTQQAAMDPRMTAHNMAVLEDARSRLVSTGMMTEVDEQKQKEHSQNRHWSIFAQTRPQEFLDRVKVEELAGLVPDGMDAQHKSSYVNTAINVLAGNRAEEARQARLLKEQHEAELESTKQDFVGKWAGGTLGTQEILSSNLPATGQGSKEHYITLMHAREKQHSEPFVKDARLMADTLEKIRQRKIVSGDQIERIYIDSAKRNHGITDEDMMKLRTELDQNRSPEGQLISQRKQDLFGGVKSSIDKSIFGQKTDSEGSLLFLQYQEWANTQLAEYQKQGKNPHDLLNPNKKELWLGRPDAIAPYQRSMRDSIRDMSKKFERPDRAPISEDKKRIEGETPTQYLERMKKK